MNSHFSCAMVINFNIIYHQCRGDKLQNPQQYYETISKNDFENYKSHIQNQVVSSAIRFEHDRGLFSTWLFKKLY